MGKKKILTLLLVTVAIGIVGGGTLGYITSPSKETRLQKEEAKHSDSPFLSAGDTISDVATQERGYVFIPLIVDLGRHRGTAKITIAIRSDKNGRKFLNFEKRHIQNDLVFFLSARQKNDFTTTGGRIALLDEIFERIKKTWGDDAVIDDVFYTKFFLYEN